MAIGLNRCISAMFFLKGYHPDERQRATQGNWVSWPQYIGDLAARVNTLPLPAAALSEAIHISFVGPRPQALNAVRTHLQVNPQRIQKAWTWLRTRNPLYANTYWSHEYAESYTQQDITDMVEMTDAPDLDRDREERPTYVADSDNESDLEEELIVGAGAVTDVNGTTVDNGTRRAGPLQQVLQSKAL
jgi:hypothetical protein